LKRGREFIDYLRDILDAAEKIEKFTQGMVLEQFKKDDKTAFAVVRALEIIGEAAKNVPEPVKDRYPSLPWKEMAGIRDKLVHEYFGADLNVVWNTVKQDIPPLKPLIAEIIEKTAK